jgi:cell fate (sporulation/competence/biofilm development) regulator YmcA (YheA/YmcA/DUF963 family)
MNTARPEAVKFQNNSRASAAKQPETVQEAIETLISDLPLKEKTTIANMTENELIKLKRITRCTTRMMQQPSSLKNCGRN